MTRHTPMDPERWRQVRDLVELAVELGVDERERLLEERCVGDPALRSEVESLLKAHDAGGTLDQPVVDLGLGILARGVATTSERPLLKDPIMRLKVEGHEVSAGDILGPYRILDELGHGGMGTVYLAQREDKEHGPYALKVAQHGLPRNAWRRFRTEYRILQGLEHPGIAQVLDAGTTDDGRPYFVMEYIEGTQIDEFCKEHELSAPERLSLVLKVCDAVDAAHRKGVVHRDLKPSNILVTADGEPKLLDFGIAKLLEPEAQSFTVDSTRTNEHPLTPQYASPEQIRSEAISPRTDVYSLGVVLYKLMTGRLPYLLERYTLVAMEHAFAGQTPPRPYAIATAPGIEMLGGGFDRNLMKALSVKVEERFETVGEFAQALRESLERRQSTTRIAVGRLRRLGFAASRIFAGRRGAVYAWALATLIVVLGVSRTYVDWPRAEAPTAEFSFRERDRILIGGIRNLTGEPILDEVLELAFRFGFESSSYVRVVPREHVRDELDDIDRDPELVTDRESGVELGRRQGAKALVMGGVTKVGGSYRVSAELIDAATGYDRFTTSAEAADQAVLVAALQEVCDDIRLYLGENAEMLDEKGILERVASTNLLALRAYNLGVEKYEEDDLVPARSYLERAIALDPDFAMAHAKLGSALWNMGRRDSVHKHFSKAAELPYRLTEFERLNTQARVTYFEGTVKESIEAWRSMIDTYPDVYVGYYNLSTILSFQTYDAEQSAQVLEKALAQGVPSEYINVFVYRLAVNYLTLGQPREYEKALQRVVPSSQRRRVLAAILVGAVFERDVQQIESLLEESRVVDPASVGDTSPVYHADFGRFREIVVQKQQAGTKRLDFQCLLIGLPDVSWAEAARDSQVVNFIEGFEVRFSEVTMDSRLSRIQCLPALGKVLARHGAGDMAKTVARFLGPFVDTRGLEYLMSFQLVLEGEILAADGFHDKATQFFQKALETQETFQVHDSLAHAYMRQGDIAAAIKESEWLVAHRGRALFEDSSTYVRVLNVISWHYAILRLARLHEGLGKRKEAIDYYQQFVDNWRHGDRPQVWQDAQRRLQELLAELER